MPLPSDVLMYAAINRDELGASRIEYDLSMTKPLCTQASSRVDQFGYVARPHLKYMISSEGSLPGLHCQLSTICNELYAAK